MARNIVIIVCSGMGKRMKSSVPKQFIEIDNKPIVCYTIDKFENCKKIDEIIIVTNKEYVDFFKNYIIEKYKYKKITNIVSGGKERFNSVYNGLKEIKDTESIVLIHDGARPFVDENDILKLIDKTKENDACILGVKAKDTIKICKSGIIESTPDRENIWLAQTPQAFRYDIIKEAYNYTIKNNLFITDDASAVENIGHKVMMLEGSYNNIKITTQEDLKNFFNN